MPVGGRRCAAEPSSSPWPGRTPATSPVDIREEQQRSKLLENGFIGTALTLGY